MENLDELFEDCTEIESAKNPSHHSGDDILAMIFGMLEDVDDEKLSKIAAIVLDKKVTVVADDEFEVEK